MKARLLLFILLLPIFALATDFDTNTLQIGECAALVDSKTYLPENPATPTEQAYKCQYECRKSADEIEKVWIMHSDSKENFNEMSGFLCAGVEIKNQVIVGSITGPQPVVHSISAFQSQFPELHAWIKSSNVPLGPVLKSQYELEAQQNISVMAKSFLTTNSPVFSAAGSILEKILQNDSDSQTLLKHYVEMLRAKNWDWVIDYRSPDDLVMLALKTHARYLDSVF